MKNIIIAVTVFGCFFLGLAAAHAQSAIDKANYKVNHASASVDNAVESASAAGATIKKIGGLFKKKKGAKATKKEDLGDFNTLFSIEGITLAKLKTLNENVKACKDVTETKIKYSGEGVSKIYVAHKGSTENLLTAVEKSSKSIFTDKNIENMDDGIVEISLKASTDESDE